MRRTNDQERVFESKLSPNLSIAFVREWDDEHSAAPGDPEADWWIFFDGVGQFIIDGEDARGLINMLNAWIKHTKAGGK